MRVLVNAIRARSGGGLTYVSKLLPLLGADLEVHLVAPVGVAFPNTTRHDIRMPRNWLLLLLWEQFIFPFHVRRIGCDLLFTTANFGPLAIGRQVIVLHNSPRVGRHERRWRKRLYWWTLSVMTALAIRRARRVIAVSHYAADIMARGHEGKTGVIHHGGGE